MKTFVLIGKDNFIEALINTTSADIDLQNHPSAIDIIEIDPDLGKIIRDYSLVIYWTGSEFKRITDPKRIWKRITKHGMSGDTAENLYKEISSADLSAIKEEENVRGTLSETVPIIKTVPPIFNLNPKPDSPDLKYRLSTEDDIPVWLEKMKESGEYSVDDSERLILRWLYDSKTWPISTIYKNEIIQIELFTFDTGRNALSVYGGFGSHVDRSRPYWFWSCVAKNLYRALDKVGYEKIYADVLPQYPSYVAFLMKQYGAKEIVNSTNSDKIHLIFNVEKALGLLPDWPERMTLGKDWKWEKGSIITRELLEDEIPLIHNYIETVWKDSGRKPLLYQTIDKRYNLDNGTLLGVFENGQLISPHIFVNRFNNLGLTLSGVSRKDNIPMNTLIKIFTGLCSWAKAKEFKTITNIIEKKLYDRNKKLYDALGYTVIKVHSQKEPMIEFSLDVEDYLRKNK